MNEHALTVQRPSAIKPVCALILTGDLDLTVTSEVPVPGGSSRR